MASANTFSECIEDYEVHNLLGKGGFASVYKARCLKTGIDVAIKMIDKKAMQAASMVGRVRQEVSIHSRLKHPAILELYTFFEDINYVYLVLELCHNGELQQYVKKKVLSENEASSIMRQVVEGMKYLHSHNILHRDMSLSNLLVTRDMQVTQKTNFSCEGRTSGYYADVSSGCQVYHMCDGLGRQFSYTCPNATLFQQRMLICDHWYMVNCSKAEEDYSANLLIGQKEKLFVEDNETNRFFRTPRTDLLSHPTASEASIIYRTGTSPSQHIVGANAENDATDEPSYFLPSHWSTEYSKGSSTQKPPQYKTNSSPFLKTSYDQTKPSISPKAKAIEIHNSFNKLSSESVVKTRQFVNPTKREDQEKIQVNLESNFKATTPVYPKTVEVTSEAGDQIGLLPPLPYAQQEKLKQEAQLPVSYQSNFKATTPVYPTSVEATSPDPGEVGLLPPQGTSEDLKVPTLNLDFEPPAFDDKYSKENRTVDPETPTKFYQPPRFLPDYTQPENEEPKTEHIIVTPKDIFKGMSSDQWNKLREGWLIPDYEFHWIVPPDHHSTPNSVPTRPNLPKVNDRKKLKLVHLLYI